MPIDHAAKSGSMRGRGFERRSRPQPAISSHRANAITIDTIVMVNSNFDTRSPGLLLGDGLAACSSGGEAHEWSGASIWLQAPTCRSGAGGDPARPRLLQRASAASLRASTNPATPTRGDVTRPGK